MRDGRRRRLLFFLRPKLTIHHGLLLINDPLTIYSPWTMIDFIPYLGGRNLEDPTWPTFLSSLDWPTLTSVVVGGVLATAGGVIGAFITHKLEKSRAKGEALRQKIEDLVSVIYLNVEWWSQRFDAVLVRGESYSEPEPIDRARMLQRLYFHPSLKDHIERILDENVLMMDWQAKWSKAREADADVFTKQRDKWMEEYRTRYTGLTIGSQEFVDAARDIMESFFGDKK